MAGAKANGPRRARPALVTAVAIGIAMVLLIAVLATRDPASTRLSRSPLVGRGAPELTGATISGERFSLDDRRGQFVLVNFFATWCVPCIEEHDDLVRFSEANRSSGRASVVSVVFSDTPKDVRRFFDRRGGDWPVVRDDDAGISTDWGVARVPESYLVDPAGTVVGKITGGVTSEFLQEQLRALEADERG